MLPSPRSRRKDLLEEITGCCVREGLLRPQKHPRRLESVQDRHVQLPLSISEPEDPEQWLGGEPHLSNDDDDAHQEANDHHREIDNRLEEGAVRLEDEPQSREAQQRNNDQGWQERRGDLYTQYIANLVSNSDVVSARKEAIQSGVQAAIRAAASSCPCCLQSHQLTQQTTQSILWVGTSFRFDLEVPVHMCHGCGTQYSPKPLEASCMPASPVHSWDVRKAPYGSRPIWFDLSLVKEVDVQLCIIKRLSMDRLTAAIMRTHEDNGCCSLLSWDTFRKTLAVAVRELGFILQRCDNMVELGAKDYPAGLLAECGGCWFAGQAGEVCGQAYDVYPLHSAYIDWCFKVPHLWTAGKQRLGEDDSTAQSGTGKYFVSDKEVLEHLQDPCASAPPPDDGKTCSDFKADEILGRLADGKYDITSLGVCLCRHGFVAYLMNSFTGERHAYATLLMKRLLEEHKPPRFVWYDIACRWSASFRKWLEHQDAETQALAGRMQFPLPPFHLYAHSVECQRTSASTCMTGAGRGNGEPHETFNADFGPIGRTTQYMTRANREARIERAAHQATEDKALRLPAQLCRMTIRASEALRAAEESAAEIMSQLRDLGLTQGEILQKMQEHVLAATASSGLEMPWEAQYAEAKLIVQKTHQAETDENTPGLSLLFEDAAFAKLAASSSKVKAAKATVRRIERSQAAALRQMDINIGSEDFQGMVAEFVQYKIQQLQVEIEWLARVRLDADALMPNLAERPADQARLMKSLQKSAGAISSRATRLKAWVTGSFVPQYMLADDVLALRETAAEWDLSQFCRGIFPWQSSCNLAVGKLTQEQLISRLVLRTRERRRSLEEMQLLQEEKELSLRLYKKQEAALRDVLASRLEQIGSLSAGSVEVHAAEQLLEAEGNRPTTINTQAHGLRGIVHLLQKRLQRVSAIQAAAQTAFGASEGVQAIGAAAACAPEYPPDALVVEDDDSDGSDVED